MRPIKFRAKKEDRWVYGGGICIFGETTIMLAADKNDIPVIHVVDGKTVGQFIGLSDKYGKDLWEGDVFENQSGRGIITWIPRHCCFGALKIGTNEFFVLTSDGMAFATEKLGNIHDNPELGEVKA
jgi:hypothetical protein